MTVLACEQPGCGGTIEDGYCDSCGLAPMLSHVAAGLTEAEGAKLCAQPGCGGTIEDGYCDSCGLTPTVVGLSAAGLEPVTIGTSTPISGSSSVSRSTTSGTGRGRLGAGLVEIPSVRSGDPATAVLSDPQVQENKRFCGSCGQPVGRGGDSGAGRIEGFCKNCGARFDFRPRLQPGELVAGQYEVLGCLAHGGLGWIYLARDRNVSDRWVVLKGLLNSGDADAQAAAVAERRFLAEVEHPNIVRIYNFVQHPDSVTGDPTGYIVMEYVGGQSLKQIVLEHRGNRQSMPLERAIAYAIEILPAFGYLHRLGLVYCDFKPDNVIQVEEQLKLIDLGGVRRVDDEEGPIYGTVGYQAPEIATDGPSPSSDLYTIGRALAVLTFEFAYTGGYEHRLPEQVTVPVLAQHESFYRLLRRATDSDPGRRFGSAADMAEQLTGVLREVLSARDGIPRAAFSARFTSELRAVGTSPTVGASPGVPDPAEVVSGLPVPVADNTDPAAGYLVTLSTLGPAEQAEALQQALAAPDAAGGVADGVEAYLALVRARLALGDIGAARDALAQLTARSISDWRASWHQGLVDLQAGRPDQARAAFNSVYDALPGELAPKLALGFAAEASRDSSSAARYFGVVWATDRGYLSAAFGLARIWLAADDRAGAVSVLDLVPDSSTHHLAAQVAAIRARLAPGGPAGQSIADITDAGRRLERLRLDAAQRHSLEGEILSTALSVVQCGTGSGTGQLLDCELTERGLRFGMERSYRALARLAASRSDRIALVDLANDARPRTLT
jgi:serine/threonine-protein kinase PknG